MTTWTPIGIDLSGRSIHAMQLSKRSRGWRVEAVASMRRPESPASPTVEETKQLADVLYRHGFRGRDVVLAVPGASLLATPLEVPPRTQKAEVSVVARDRLAVAHKCEPQSLEVACWDLPETARPGQDTRAIAVGCPIEQANALIDPFEAAGMVVRALDVDAWAAVRACQPHLSEAPRLVGIVNVGWAAVHLVIHSAGVVVHERTLAEHGVQHLHARLADVFGLEPDVIDYIVGRMGLKSDGFMTEVSSTLQAAIGDVIRVFLEKLESELRRSVFYATQEYAAPGSEEAVGRLIVHGEGASMPGLDEHIASALDVTVETAAPVDMAKCSTSLSAACRSPALIAAMGLALHPGK